jgi:hypothetical protein
MNQSVQSKEQGKRKEWSKIDGGSLALGNLAKVEAYIL